MLFEIAYSEIQNQDHEDRYNDEYEYKTKSQEIRI